jgi:hypothetical protein
VNFQGALSIIQITQQMLPIQIAQQMLATITNDICLLIPDFILFFICVCTLFVHWVFDYQRLVLVFFF